MLKNGRIWLKIVGFFNYEVMQLVFSLELFLTAPLKHIYSLNLKAA